MRVLQVSCGENHSLALIEMSTSTDDDNQSTKQTKLFVWGNNDKWQLGMDNSEDPNQKLNIQDGEEPQSAKEISVPHFLDQELFGLDETKGN